MGSEYTPYTALNGCRRKAAAAVLCASAAVRYLGPPQWKECKGGTLSLQKDPSAERNQSEAPRLLWNLEGCRSIGGKQFRHAPPLPSIGRHPVDLCHPHLPAGVLVPATKSWFPVQHGCSTKDIRFEVT